MARGRVDNTNARGRDDGKKKRKSIKANVTSKFGTERKLSRMGKKVKKGQMGPNTEFITRSTVLTRLQISLKDFRRLCILKGIYPRVPSKPPKGADKVYYDIKDISYLAHEPLLAKFREFKAFMKKIRKAAGRRQYGEARRRDDMKPMFKLDHLVKERYPRFIDALRDMDDALCMVHLFAALPSQGRVTVKRTSACQQLVSHWQYYVARSRCLRKVFVSVKGVYYQCTVLGEDITWLAPHPFTQAFPREVDFRVMITFLEFYEVFLKFALFKLYHSQGLQYPPVRDEENSAAGGVLLAIKAAPLESSGAVSTSSQSLTQSVVLRNSEEARDKEQEHVNGKSGTKKDRGKLLSTVARLATLEDKMADILAKDEQEEEEDDEDEEPIGAPLEEAFQTRLVGLGSRDEERGEGEEERRTFALPETDSVTRLFSGLMFFVNKEVPLDCLQLCVLSFGGTVGWDGPGSPWTVDDPSITHHIVDRPVQSSYGAGRELIQPQWVFDSVNAQLLLPVLKYRPGVALPPHLSPFVDDEKEGYLPKYREELSQLKSVVQTLKSPGEDEEVEGADEGEVEDYVEAVRAEREGKSYSAGKREDVTEKLDGDSDEDEDEELDGGEDTNVEDKSAEEEEEEEVIDPKTKKGPKAVVYAPETSKLTDVS